VTARWVVDISEARDLHIVWEPISLRMKNNTSPDSEHYSVVAWSTKLLRVMESAREAGGDDAVFPLYIEYGRRIHHDREREWEPAEALAAVGLDASHAAAAEDASWDDVVRRRMDEGLALVGEDVGTPLIAYEASDGRTVANFGPVIARVPPGEDGLRLWDAFTTLTETDEFFELKRARAQRPEFGERP
jgi:hypothetical protein